MGSPFLDIIQASLLMLLLSHAWFLHDLDVIMVLSRTLADALQSERVSTDVELFCISVTSFWMLFQGEHELTSILAATGSASRRLMAQRASLSKAPPMVQ
jgi:hypothetical protein